MDHKDVIKELGAIRHLMERSSKFISISGLSGILIGIYALIGAGLAFLKVYGFKSSLSYRDHYVNSPEVVLFLCLVALSVLTLSMATGLWMAKRKAQRLGQSVWNTTSRSLLFAMAVPLCTGGILSLLFISKGMLGLIASTLLIFYGLSLSAGSIYTFKEVKWLGIFEILLGLLALLLPGYGLFFWAMGFGILHIIYGFIVYKKYE